MKTKIKILNNIKQLDVKQLFVNLFLQGLCPFYKYFDNFRSELFQRIFYSE